MTIYSLEKAIKLALYFLKILQDDNTYISISIYSTYTLCIVLDILLGYKEVENRLVGSF